MSFEKRDGKFCLQIFATDYFEEMISARLFSFKFHELVFGG